MSEIRTRTRPMLPQRSVDQGPSELTACFLLCVWVFVGFLIGGALGIAGGIGFAMGLEALSPGGRIVLLLSVPIGAFAGALTGIFSSLALAKPPMA